MDLPGHTETSFASLGFEEVDTHLVWDHSLGSLILGLKLCNGGVTEGTEAGHTGLVGALSPSGGLSGGAGFVVGHLTTNFILVFGDVVSGHTEPGHARLVGKSIGAHLEMDKALGIAVLVIGLADIDDAGHADAGHTSLGREFVGTRLEGHDTVGCAGLLFRDFLSSTGALGFVVHITNRTEGRLTLLGCEFVGTGLKPC